MQFCSSLDFNVNAVSYMSSCLRIWIAACGLEISFLTWQDDNPHILKIIFCRIYLSTLRTYDEFELQI
jgi:hypothetical protein